MDITTTHSLENLKYYHQQATQFFASEIMLLKDVQPRIKDERIGQAATLLRSACNTGAALLQLANQTDIFRSQSVMLARSFMETVINFCYACICDEREFRAFLLHRIYKQYHNAGNPKLKDDLEELHENIKKAGREAGEAAGKIHRAGSIIHLFGNEDRNELDQKTSW